MTTLLITLLACLTVAYLGRGFFTYLRSRDDLHHQERRELYTRIQTPEFAPRLAAVPDVVDDTTGYTEEREILKVLGRDV